MKENVIRAQRFFQMKDRRDAEAYADFIELAKIELNHQSKKFLY